MTKLSKKNDSYSSQDQIRALTASLASGNPILMNEPPETKLSKSMSLNDPNPLLYRFGHETNQQSSRRNSLSRSIHSNNDRINHISEFSDSLSDFYDTIPTEDESHIKFLLNLEKNRVKSQKFVSGSQFRNFGKDHSRCLQCDYNEKLVKKSKETIRTLKLQLGRLEDSYRDLKKSKIIDNNSSLLNIRSMSTNDDSLCNQEEYNNLIKKYEAMEEEFSRLKRSLNFEKSSNESLKKSFEEAKNSSKQEISELNKKNQVLEEEIDILREQNGENLKHLKEMNSTLLLYRKQLEKSEIKYNDTITGIMDQYNELSDSTKELERLKSEISNLESNNSSLIIQLNNKASKLTEAEAEIESLKHRLAQNESELKKKEIELTGTQEELKNSNEQIQVVKKRFDVMEQTINIQENEKKKTQKVLDDLNRQVESDNMTISALQKEIDSIKQFNNTDIQKYINENDLTKKSLERALNSSVRLCVVAPTVNVHAGDTKLKFKSKISEDSIKEFLDKEVFEKYTFVFKQKTDNSSPYGENLETWLQRILSQMQVSIEKHVNSAMNDSAL